MISQSFTDTAALLIDTDFARGASITCLTQCKAMRARPDAGAKSIREPKGGDMRNKKIRYAVVGLGHIAQTAVLPAFKHAENSELAAVVTGNRERHRNLREHDRERA